MGERVTKLSGGERQRLALSPPVLGLFLACFAGMFLYLGLRPFWPAARALSTSRYLPLMVLAGATFIGRVQCLGAWLRGKGGLHVRAYNG